MNDDITHKIISVERAPEALVRYEKIIEEGFIKAGQAFKVIWKFKLWEENYKTFEEYCKKRWNYSRQHVTNWVRQSDLLLGLGEEFETMVSKLSERVVRELAPLPTSESQKEVLKEVLSQNSEPDYKEMRKQVEKKLVELLPATDQRVQKIKKKSDRSIKVAEKQFSKLWIEFRNTYSDIPMWELDKMAIKVIQNH